jgi:uncharacterized DUF497 family protein
MGIAKSSANPRLVLLEGSEQAFFNQPLVAMPDHEHSDDEERILVLGKTDSGRKLFVVCTIRGDLICVISARNMTRREREVYFRYG